MSDEKAAQLERSILVLSWTIGALVVVIAALGLIALRNFMMINDEVEGNWCSDLNGYTVVEDSTYVCVKGDWQ